MHRDFLRALTGNNQLHAGVSIDCRQIPFSGSSAFPDNAGRDTGDARNGIEG